MKQIFFFLLLSLSLFSCEKAENNFDSKVQAIMLAPKSEKSKFTQNDLASPSKPTEAIEPKIIKEGNLRFETKDLQATYNQIIKNITASGGTIQSDVEGNDYESVFRKLIIRIPSQKFDVFMTNITKGVRFFDTKEITSEDVTAEYIDINARLNAKKTLENRYLELLKKATKVTEMLEIETQLSLIREEIEAKQASLNYLQNRVAFSTITIEFYKTVAQESGATVSYGTKIWTAITSGFNSLSGLFIWLLSVWPYLIITIVVLYFIRKKIKTKKS